MAQWCQLKSVLEVDKDVVIVLHTIAVDGLELQGTRASGGRWWVVVGDAGRVCVYGVCGGLGEMGWVWGRWGGCGGWGGGCVDVMVVVVVSVGGTLSIATRDINAVSVLNQSKMHYYSQVPLLYKGFLHCGLSLIIWKVQWWMYSYHDLSMCPLSNTFLIVCTKYLYAATFQKLFWHFLIKRYRSA